MKAFVHVQVSWILGKEDMVSPIMYGLIGISFALCRSLCNALFQ